MWVLSSRVSGRLFQRGLLIPKHAVRCISSVRSDKSFLTTPIFYVNAGKNAGLLSCFLHVFYLLFFVFLFLLLFCFVLFLCFLCLFVCFCFCFCFVFVFLREDYFGDGSQLCQMKGILRENASEVSLESNFRTKFYKWLMLQVYRLTL